MIVNDSWLNVIKMTHSISRRPHFGREEGDKSESERKMSSYYRADASTHIPCPNSSAGRFSFDFHLLYCVALMAFFISCTFLNSLYVGRHQSSFAIRNAPNNCLPLSYIHSLLLAFWNCWLPFRF